MTTARSCRPGRCRTPRAPILYDDDEYRNASGDGPRSGCTLGGQDGALGYTDVEHLEMPGEFPLPDSTTWIPCEEPGVGPQLEGVAVDQRTSVLYATQEDVGLWRIRLPLATGTPEYTRQQRSQA